MRSTHTSFRLLLLAVFLIGLIGCKSSEQRQAELKKHRLERIWTNGALDSLRGIHKEKLYDRLGEPDRDNWYGPDFGTVLYDSLRIGLDSNVGIRIKSIMVTIRDNHVAEVDTLTPAED